jgi:hypothetical protein
MAAPANPDIRPGGCFLPAGGGRAPARGGPRPPARRVIPWVWLDGIDMAGYLLY